MQKIPFDPANDEIMERLRNVPAFDALPDHLIRQAMKAASIRRYDASEVVIREGEFDNRVFFLVFGNLEISVQGKVVGCLQRLGDIFGEMGISDASPRSATITAIQTTLVVALDDTAIRTMGETGKMFTQAVMYRVFAEVLAVRLRAANHQIDELHRDIDAIKK
ncbi:MAG: cyclic nucleotide-binding domain-containing protein [Pseudodesulfovibrio sp.]|uniref:Cyclic nucleotide-binding protein n=1 Tax=Pseudodesulfovibrio aespoeensis (strain ATCC 700646 / DSM 10631 / Aspo-2) TaxID=643562 RepID=E6VSK6_PSEA9|nr:MULTISPECIES: cyclic nucleotide-binding domain-containing protein [Pseudodesulfovibrio]MBU4191374.1 cyclic nucleotide-binding domain-containing protein [Pseudomonadota bacterium]ADU61991.1 cyclic nucleotide-binding protein [Pseudodesulfovibrio aespoeensis Aspo-2]MBU4244802.1 cyclic nucleotide-binding domain-containing protein [Pseudomonadota bacterium]MBU4379247.1 cyclic nucleotide-binding domain-containing protein [Pseudomonadota bacterium]MBU4476321.1 cyclic nucleotide-binding domain-cont